MRRIVTLLSLTIASTAGAQQSAAHAEGHGAHGAGAAMARPAVSAAARPARYTGRVVTITAKDFAFEAPDSIEAGYVTIRLLARGTELHHTQIARLDGGHSLKELFAAMSAPGAKPPAWFVEVGGPNAAAPGGESAASLELVPGRYVLLCFIPSPDGTPHVMKGMAKEFVVTPAKAKSAKNVAPKAPATVVTLTDYDFTFSKPLVAGEQTIRLVNAAEQHHELFIARLAPGKTAMELAQWAEKSEGPPPGMPLGGITGIDKGGWNDVTLVLEPGEYALVCFLPDAKDGKPHLVHGMIKQITVAPRVAKQ